MKETRHLLRVVGSFFLGLVGLSFWHAGSYSDGLVARRVLNDDGGDIACKWSPHSPGDCLKLLTDRSAPQAESTAPADWLFFGDSTMKKMFYSGLKQELFDQPLGKCPACSRHVRSQHSDCKFNHMFDLGTDYDGVEWIEPGENEGPTGRAGQTPRRFCQDCSGCFSQFASCPKDVRDSIKMNATLASSGTLSGYECESVLNQGLAGCVGIEFARDREVQDTAANGPKTTQEAVSAFLSKTWSSAPLKKGRISTEPTSGEPFISATCFLGAGVHDITIKGITLEAYIANVEWYLDLLRPICSKYVWIYNAAPASDESRYPQTIENTFEWNEAVGSLLRSDKYRSVSTIIDVYDASTKWPHDDHVHMDKGWYGALASLFLKVRKQVNERLHISSYIATVQ